MKVGDIIKKYRIKSGLTQSELALKISKSLRTIQKYEANEIVPKGKVLTEIANAFNVPIDEFHLEIYLNTFNQINEITKNCIEAHKIKNLMDGEYGTDGVALYFLFHDVVKNKFHCDFEKLSDSELDEILNNMYFSIELKLNEILNRHENKKDYEFIPTTNNNEDNNK